MNLAVIPARGGSSRIKRKNVRQFFGKPIIAYSIQTAKGSGLFEKVMVTTEDELIGGVAKRYGAKLHQRPKYLADDAVGTQAVTKAVIEWWMKCANGELPEFVCCIYATAPLMLGSDLRSGLEMLRHGTMDFVYTCDKTGKDAGQFYWGRPAAFLEDIPLTRPHAMPLYLPSERVCDINTMEDFERAERMYGALTESRAAHG